MFRTFIDRVFWNEDSPDLPASIVGFIQTFSYKAVTSSKISALHACSVHVMLLNFRKEYKRRLVQNEHSLVTFVPDETENSESMTKADIGGLRKSLYCYSMLHVLNGEELILLTSDTEGRERTMETLHKSTHMARNDLESTCTAGFHDILKSSMGLNCFTTLASYCCDIPEGNNIGWIRHGLSVRRPCLRSLSVMEDI